SGGTYLALRNGEPTGFAPLKALDFTPANRAFLGALVRRMVAAGRPLGVVEEQAIDAALAALAPMPPAARSFAALRALLGQRDAGGIGARLESWMRGG